jgi:regulator of extracellular matrix RemA (YlzA/DUF370 family)
MPGELRCRANGPIEVGFGGVVAGERIVAVANPESAPIARMMRRARERGQLIDLTCGRRIRAVLFMDSGHIVRVAVSPKTLLARWAEPAHTDPKGLGDL